MVEGMRVQEVILCLESFLNLPTTSQVQPRLKSSGFAAYPFASTPSVSATAGNAQVALSWTASQGFVGWTVSGYDIGQSTVAGGPYTLILLSAT